VLTVGNFDGLHVGHRTITDTVVNRAHEIGGVSVLYTLEPHPRKVLTPDNAPPLLTTIEQKCELIEAAGVDVLIVEPFDREFARTSAESFIRDILHRQIAPEEVYVGYDFHFGRDREGSMRLLGELGPRLGFAVTIIPEMMIDEGDVNSTRIRKLLGDGEIERAARMLGRPYSIRGTVVEGDRRGRTIGFPTANLAPENDVVPGAGVYAGRLRFLDEGEPRTGAGAGEDLPVVTNVGQRPTFGADGEVRVEAHIIDFEGDVYGRRGELSFAKRLRPEQRFAGVDELKQQIAADVEQARKLLVSP
jgi:riboflavin kinase/FMN adenylyltransferase